MNIRTIQTMITFDHPFRMSGAEGVLPAGTYRVVTDEEQVPGLSFIAYRRMATMLHTPAISAPQGRSASLAIDPVELDAAQMKDRQQSAGSPEIPSSATAPQLDVPTTGKSDVASVSQH